MARLASLGFDGEQRGHRAEPGLEPARVRERPDGTLTAGGGVTA